MDSFLRDSLLRENLPVGVLTSSYIPSHYRRYKQPVQWVAAGRAHPQHHRTESDNRQLIEPTYVFATQPGRANPARVRVARLDAVVRQDGQRLIIDPVPPDHY
jgi:hypothetical protein